jgi:hypothetical protein
MQRAWIPGLWRATVVIALAALTVGLADSVAAQRGGRGGGRAGGFQGGARPGPESNLGRSGRAEEFNPAQTGSIRYGRNSSGFAGGSAQRPTGRLEVGGATANWNRFDANYIRRFPAGYRTFWYGSYPYYWYPTLPSGATPVTYGATTGYVYDGVYFVPYFYEGQVVYVAVPPL